MIPSKQKCSLNTILSITIKWKRCYRQSNRGADLLGRTYPTVLILEPVWLEDFADADLFMRTLSSLVVV